MIFVGVADNGKTTTSDFIRKALQGKIHKELICYDDERERGITISTAHVSSADDGFYEMITLAAIEALARESRITSSLIMGVIADSQQEKDDFFPDDAEHPFSCKDVQIVGTLAPSDFATGVFLIIHWDAHKTSMERIEKSVCKDSRNLEFVVAHCDSPRNRNGRQRALEALTYCVSLCLGSKSKTSGNAVFSADEKVPAVGQVSGKGIFIRTALVRKKSSLKKHPEQFGRESARLVVKKATKKPARNKETRKARKADGKICFERKPGETSSESKVETKVETAERLEI